MNNGEPPSRPQQNSSPFLVGRNSRGHWVVQDPSGLCGGLFVSRAEALRFALLENGHGPQAVIMVPGNLELHIGRAVKSAAAMPAAIPDVRTPQETIDPTPIPSRHRRAARVAAVAAHG